MNTVNVSFGYLLCATSQDRGLDRDSEGRVCARKEFLVTTCDLKGHLQSECIYPVKK